MTNLNERRSGVRRVACGVGLIFLATSVANCSMLDSKGQDTSDPVPLLGPQVHKEKPISVAPTTAVKEPEAAKAVEKVIRRGTGIFIDRSAVAQPSLSTTAGGETAINFRNAPIAEVVKSILGDVLGEPYVIDPSVQGTISIQTSGALPAAAILPTLEQTLQLNGLALFRANGIYQIAPIEAVAGGLGLAPVLAIPGRADPGFGISIIPMKFAAAGEVSELIGPFVPDGVILQTDEDRNLFLIAGSGPARANLLDLIRTFDVDWMKGMSLGMFPLEYAEALTIADELGEIFSNQENASAAGIIRFVPLERLNSILVITHNATYLERVEDWLTRLDVGQEELGGRSLKVYRIQNGRAVELAAILGELFDAQPSSNYAPGPGFLPGRRTAVAPGLEPRTITSGIETASSMEVTPRRQPGRGAIQGFVQYETGLRVIADESNNALVILASETEHRLIRTALRELDVPPLQVLIEATIAEVTLNEELRFGLQWFFNSRNSEFTLSNFSTGAVSPVFPGFSYVLDNNNDVRVVLDALDDITNVRVISSPQLMVLNNHTAFLQVGDQVPVLTRSAVSTIDPDSPIVNEIEFKDTGVILQVTPRVNAGGLVIIDIEQEVSSVVLTTTSGINSPTIQRRRISSTISVQSGETIALGGLIQESIQTSETGIPYLSRIPILGNLFKSSKDIELRTELLILITPRVVRNFEEARLVTQELRERLKGLDVFDIKKD